MTEAHTGQEHEFSFRGKVEPNRRLIREVGSLGLRVEEFIDVRTSDRFLAIPSSVASPSRTVELHRQLARRHIPVFPMTDVTETHVLLDAPRDARLLSDSLRFIARDIQGYSKIFEQVGELYGRCQASGLGLPKEVRDRGVLDSISYSVSDEAYGSSVYLIPPYILDPEIPKQDAMATVEGVLQSSHYLNGPQIDELLHAMDEGWNAVRR